MLGAVRMREPWASVGIMGGRLHMRLRTFCCPPARDVSLRITHLHAAAAQVRFRTMAVAPARRNTPQQCGCVRKERERAAQENDSLEVESAQGTPPRDGLVDEAAHESILRKERGKTDRPGVRISCYQGPGTGWQEGEPDCHGEGPFPIPTGARSDLVFEYGFGSGKRVFYKAKLKIIRYLYTSEANSTLAGTMH
jgi:hypothetical protein